VDAHLAVRGGQRRGLAAPGAHVVGGCCRVRPADIAALVHVVETPGPL
jgi:S-methylmethionine-dependent homocysteine/selenocysteine methylase